MVENRENIIENYIKSYNNFDADGMVNDFDDYIVFENIQNGSITHTLQGVDEFKEQAVETKAYFSSRLQKILSFKHNAEETEIEIEYKATLAVDLTEEHKKGSEIKLNGKSIFKFSDQNKIVKLTDFS